MKFAVAVFTAVVCLALCIMTLAQRLWVAAALLLAVTLAFCFIAFLYGSVLTLDAAGIERRFLGVRVAAVRWGELAEVGVVGLKVFNNGSRERPGTRYIYFSPRALDEEQRFRLALEWPPGDMLYLNYTKERLRAVQNLWNAPVESYNAGDAFF